MNTQAHGAAPRVYARVAGLLYLAIIVSGLFGEVFVRTRLIVAGDAEATAANILGADALFRAGFVADSVMLFCDVGLAVLLYVLLRPVGQTLALLAAVFRLMQAAILGGNLLNYHAALLLLSGGAYESSLAPGQAPALAMFHLDLHAHGYDLGLLFFGLSNLFLGSLVAGSRFLPAVLGYGLIAAGVVYLVGSYARFLWPAGYEALMPLYLVPVLAELAFALWLLIKGVRPAAGRVAAHA